HFIDDGILPRPTAPVVVAPLECRGIDDHTGAVDTFGIETRRWIGDHQHFIDAITVAITRDETIDGGFVPATRALQADSPRSGVRSLELQLHAVRAGRPQSEACAAIRIALRPE